MGWLGQGEHRGYIAPFLSCPPPSLPPSLPPSTSSRHNPQMSFIYNQNTLSYHGLCRAHKNGRDIYSCKFSAGLGSHVQGESCRSDNAQAAIPRAEIPAGTAGHGQEDAV